MRSSVSADSPFRVLQLNKRYWPHFGGIERHLHDLASALALRQDVSVSALVCRDARQPDHWRNRAVDIQGVRSYGTLWSLPVAPLYPVALRRLLVEEPDVVHLHEPFPLGVISWLLCTKRAHPPPLVVTWHSDVVRQRAALPIYAVLLRELLRRASAVIVPSELHISASQFLPDVAQKCHTIPFGIDLARYTSPEIPDGWHALEGGARVG